MPQQQPPIRIAGVVRDSIVDGPGLRLTLFVQGCPHHCPGCHNPQTHDPAGGSLCPPSRILEELDKNPLLAGLTLSGGEPVEQAEALLPLARAVAARGKNLCLYSGYTFEQLCKMQEQRPALAQLLSLCWLLMDGPYIAAQRDLSRPYVGSRNQRVLDLPASLAAGRAVPAAL